MNSCPDLFWIMLTAFASWGLVVVSLFTSWSQIKTTKRLNSVQVLMTYETKFDSKEMLAARSKFANQLLNEAPHQEIQEDVLNFFESIGLLLRLKVLDKEMVWCNFSYYAIYWEHVCKDYINEERKLKDDDPTLFEEFRNLSEEMYEIDMKKRKKDRQEITPSKEKVLRFLTDEKGLINDDE
jgi:hypothetical protein